MAEAVIRRNIEFAGPPSLGARVPPQAVEIEAQILGAMLIDREATSKVLEILDEEAFHADYHRKIFQAMVALFERSEPVDTITLTEELRRRGHLEVIGGEPYLVELTIGVTSAANVEFHARIVLEKSLLRGLISASSQIATRAFGQSEDAFELLDSAEQSIFQISERRMKHGYRSMSDAVHDTLGMLESIHGTHSGVTGIPTGFRDLDTLTGGWQNSDLIIIAGRPSMGKTAFALSLARNAALDAVKPTPVGIFSLEMSIQQLVMRLLCAEARVDAHKVRTGRLPEDDWKHLAIAAGRLAKTNVYIDDTAALGILELRAKARRLKVDKNIGLIIVDYLQLMQGPQRSESREKEISAISRSLKALAKELNIPVIALSQLSRAVESRTDKRPILSDLRESGAIEQDSDVVAFVHRQEKYENLNTEEGQDVRGLAEIIVGKQRNGPVDDIKLTFVHQYARFENRAPDAFNVVPTGGEPF